MQTGANFIHYYVPARYFPTHQGHAAIKREGKSGSKADLGYSRIQPVWSFLNIKTTRKIPKINYMTIRFK
jgi:hypothetical protein